MLRSNQVRCDSGSEAVLGVALVPGQNSKIQAAGWTQTQNGPTKRNAKAKLQQFERLLGMNFPRARRDATTDA